MGILLFPLAALLLVQQEVNPELVPIGTRPPKSVAIDGKVVDATTYVAIAGAKVKLQYATSPVALQSVTSEVGGAFHFFLDHPGDYAVEASNEGYLSASKKLRVDEKDVSGITLEMPSSAKIRGTVRDGDTKRGLSNFTVSALRVNYFRGRREIRPGGTTFTDERGDFELEGLQSGGYLLEIKKFPPGEILAERRTDVPASQTRYPQTIWPGDARATDPVPIALSSGETDIGYVNLTKMNPGLIRGEVTGLDCAKDPIYELTVQQRFESRAIEERAARLPCGSGFTVPDLSAGVYRVWARPLSDVRQLAVTDFQVEAGSEMDIRLALKEWPWIGGSVIFDCKGDCSTITHVQSVSLLPVTRNPSNDPLMWGSEARVDGTGAFQGLMPLSGPLRVVVGPFPEHFFIKHVLYDGAEVGSVFQPHSSASAQTLRIVLSDKLSELTGTVQQDGQPVLKTHIVLAPWPLIADDGWSAATVVETDSDGRFHFPGLMPGTYRAVSVKSADWERRDLPGVLNGWLAGAEDIALGDAETRVVVVR